MPDEEKEEHKQNIIASLAIFGLIGLLIGFGASFFTGKVLLAILIFLIGLVAGLIHYGAKSSGLAILFFVIALFLLLFVKSGFSFPQLGINIGGFFKWAFSPLIELWKCGPGGCPLLGEETQQQQLTTPDFELSLEYGDDYIENGQIDLFVGLKLSNKRLENLTLYPYCYKKSNNESLAVVALQSYQRGDYFVIPRSERELSTGFRCQGASSAESEKLVIGFRIPYAASLGWKIYSSSEWKEISEKKGLQQASESPYRLEIEMPSDMPLSNGEYDFFLLLRQSPGYDLELEEIKYIKAESSPDVNIYCSFDGKQVKEIAVSKEKIQKCWNKDKKGCVFSCKLVVSDATPTLEQRIISFAASYVLKKEFEKELKARK
ncbi:MAG: phage holin family protein [Candidatus Pacearchaeota archaeon]